MKNSRKMPMKESEIRKIVKKSYGKIATNEACCSCKDMSNEQIAKNIGYSQSEINIAPNANMGLGCGNPTSLGEINEGMTVLDLGSGAGFDCFLASKKVGNAGKVIGVDMTEKMITKAKENAKRYGFQNVEFRLGDIEELPVNNDSIDIIMSNCVINLAPNKSKVFNEAYRVLKKGGKLLVSDIVLLKELPESDRQNEKLIAGCVGGALLKKDYIGLVKKAGFMVQVLSEDRKISKMQYDGFPVESLKIAAIK